MEMGVWGLALWLPFWGACLARLWRIRPRRTDPGMKIVVGTVFAGRIGALVAFDFLPLMQSVSLMVWLWKPIPSKDTGRQPVLADEISFCLCA
jgi:hypothetical protein